MERMQFNPIVSPQIAQSQGTQPNTSLVTGHRQPEQTNADPSPHADLLFIASQRDKRMAELLQESRATMQGDELPLADADFFDEIRRGGKLNEISLKNGATAFFNSTGQATQPPPSKALTGHLAGKSGEDGVVRPIAIKPPVLDNGMSLSEANMLVQTQALLAGLRTTENALKLTLYLQLQQSLALAQNNAAHKPPVPSRSEGKHLEQENDGAIVIQTKHGKIRRLTHPRYLGSIQQQATEAIKRLGYDGMTVSSTYIAENFPAKKRYESRIIQRADMAMRKNGDGMLIHTGGLDHNNAAVYAIELTEKGRREVEQSRSFK